MPAAHELEYGGGEKQPGPEQSETVQQVKAVLNERGQSLIEFVLLLLVVATISFMFVKLVNNQIAGIWVDIVKIIVDDETQNSRLEL